MRPYHPILPALLLLLALASPAPAQTVRSGPLADMASLPDTLPRRARSGGAPRVEIYFLPPIQCFSGIDTTPVLTRRIEFDPKGRPITDLALRDGGDSAVLITYRYDADGRLLTARSEPTRLERGTPARRADGIADSATWSYRLDARKRPLERTMLDAAGREIERTRFTYDEQGRPAADSSYVGGALARFRSHLYAPEGGRVISTFIPSSGEAPRLVAMEELDSAGLPARRITFREGGSTDIRYEHGDPTLETISDSAGIRELRHEYTRDRRGNRETHVVWLRSVDPTAENGERVGGVDIWMRTLTERVVRGKR